MLQLSLIVFCMYVSGDSTPHAMFVLILRYKMSKYLGTLFVLSLYRTRAVDSVQLTRIIDWPTLCCSDFALRGVALPAPLLPQQLCIITPSIAVTPLCPCPFYHPSKPANQPWHWPCRFKSPWSTAGVHPQIAAFAVPRRRGYAASITEIPLGMLDSSFG